MAVTSAEDGASTNVVRRTGAARRAVHEPQVAGVGGGVGVGGEAVRLDSKGQVTIPAPLRELHGLREGDELDVVEYEGTLRIVRVEGSESHGNPIVRRVRGRATTAMTTGQLLHLLRDE